MARPFDPDNIARRLDRVARKVALDSFARVVRRTPVKSGRARGSWGVSVSAPRPGPHDRIDPNGTAVNAEAASAVDLLEIGDSIFLTSNLVYMPPLENGSSQQAPAGMLRITRNEIQPIADAAVKAVLFEGL